MRKGSQIALKTAADVAGKLIVFAVVVIAARVLGREVFGAFSLAWTLGWLLGVASDSGLSLHLAREVARRPEAAAAIFGPTLRLRFGLAGAAAVLAAFLVGAGVGGPAPLAFLAVVLAQLAAAQVDFVNHLFRGLSRTEVESGLTIGNRIALVTMVGAALAWKPTLGSMAGALVAHAALVLAAGLYLARRHGALAPVRGVVDIPVRRFTAEVLPIGLAALASALYFRVDLFIIDAWRGAESVGLYNAVFRLVEAVRLLPAAVLAVWFPVLCNSQNRAAVSRLSVGLFAAGAAIAAVLWPLSAPLIRAIYGQDFLAAAPAFGILLLSVPLLFLNYALTLQLVGWNQPWPFLKIATTALVANVLANVALVPAFGIRGAAWATLLTELVVTAGAVVALRRARPPLSTSTSGWRRPPAVELDAPVA